jgi:hypothetical protein
MNPDPFPRWYTIAKTPAEAADLARRERARWESLGYGTIADADMAEHIARAARRASA